MDALPSTESFLGEFGLASEAKAPQQPMVSREQAREVLASSGVSAEFRDLLIQYCAANVSAYELDQIDWRALAKRLGTQPSFLAEAASSMDTGGAFWAMVLEARIKRAHAARVFRDASWERLESLAVSRLVVMAEKNMIRDPGELLAVASQARRANEAKMGSNGGGNGGQTVNINIGGDSMDGDNGLPAAGTKMTIDLSKRVATALAERRSTASEAGSRVIDGQMLSAQELRSALDSQQQGPAVDETLDEGELG